MAPRAEVRPEQAPRLEVEETFLERGDVRWTVRVLGRSAGRGRRPVPLLLLGFWESAEPRGPHALEALVPGQTLAELGPERLEEALARAAVPTPPGRRKPFFEVPGQGRRGGAPPQEG